MRTSINLLIALLCVLCGQTATVVVIQPASAPASPTYLFDEDFEGTGYENSWTEDLGTPDEDDTSPVASGSQSLRIQANQRITCNTTWTAPSTAYVFGAIYFTTDAPDNVIYARNGTTDVWWLQRRGTDEFRVYHGTAFAETSGTYATGQWTYFWIHYTAGSGSNGTLDAYFSTTTTKPGSPTLSITTGTSTLGMDRFYIRWDETADFNLDHLLVDDVSIGSAP